jgi:[ribosomal protein S5]-alanine N-acetyltransferase
MMPPYKKEISSFSIVSPHHISSAESLLDFHLKNKEFFAHAYPTYHPQYFSLSFWEEKLNFFRTSWDEEKSLRFFIIKNQKVIGSVGYDQLSRGPFQACFLGYALDKDHQGQGIMGQTLQETISILFKNLNFHRIMANYVPTNEKSGKVLTSLGFEKERLAKDYLKLNGKWEDHVLTSLINKEWKEETHQ